MQAYRLSASWQVMGLLAGMVLVQSLQAQPGSGRTADARDRATRQLAVHTAARRFWEAVPEVANPSDARRATLREQLRAVMQEDPVAHRQQADSMTLARAFMHERQQAWLDAQRQQMLQEARNQSPLPISEDDLTTALGERGTQRIAEELATFDEQVFPGLFEAARELAVAAMRELLDRRARRPGFDALDVRLLELGEGGFIGRPWSAAAEEGLRDWLAPYVGVDDMPLFEEVEAYARDLARQEADRIRNQYLQQAAAAERKLDAPAILELRLAGDIAARIVEQVELESDVPLYSGVRQHVLDLAETAEDLRLRNYVKETPLMVVPEEVLADQMRADRQAHRRRDASRKRLLDQYRDSLIAPVVTSYAEDLEHAQAHLEARLRDPGTASGAAFADRVATVLDGAFPVVRDAWVAAQWATKGTVLDALRALPDAVLAGVVERDGQVWNQLDPALAWFANLELELLPEGVDRSLLLEENETRMLSQINDAMRAGFAVVQAQLAALRELEGERSAQLQEAVQAGRTYEELHVDWRTALADSWAEQIATHPDYPRLTPPVEQALDRAVRQYFDAVRQATEESIMVDALEATEEAVEVSDTAEPQELVAETDTSQEDAEDSEDEEDEGAGAGVPTEAEAGRRIAPDIVLVLRGDDETRVQVELLVRGADTTEAWELDARDPEASAQQIFDRIQPTLAGLTEARSAAASRFLGIWRRPPAPLHVYTVVESRAVRHRMSLLLHEKIEAYLRQEFASDTPVSLRWETGLRP